MLMLSYLFYEFIIIFFFFSCHCFLRSNFHSDLACAYGVLVYGMELIDNHE